jgi:hypothetical protein
VRLQLLPKLLPIQPLLSSLLDLLELLLFPQMMQLVLSEVMLLLPR